MDKCCKKMKHTFFYSIYTSVTLYVLRLSERHRFVTGKAISVTGREGP
jgi:hypothetical protein